MAKALALLKFVNEEKIMIDAEELEQKPIDDSVMITGYETLRFWTETSAKLRSYLGNEELIFTGHYIELNDRVTYIFEIKQRTLVIETEM